VSRCHPDLVSRLRSLAPAIEVGRRLVSVGLAGLAVEHVVLTAVGLKIVQLVTDDPDAARCPGCRVVSTSGKDWVLTRPREKCILSIDMSEMPPIRLLSAP
jgi:hypothetical protein